MRVCFLIGLLVMFSPTVLAQTDLQAECQSLLAANASNNVEARLPRAVARVTDPMTVLIAYPPEAVGAGSAMPHVALWRVEPTQKRTQLRLNPPANYRGVAVADGSVRCTAFDVTATAADALTPSPLRYEIVVSDFQAAPAATEPLRGFILQTTPEPRTVQLRFPTDPACEGLTVAVDAPGGYNWADFRRWIAEVNREAQARDVIKGSYNVGQSPRSFVVRSVEIAAGPLPPEATNSANLCLKPIILPPGRRAAVNVTFDRSLFDLPSYRPLALNASAFRRTFEEVITTPAGVAIGLDRDPAFANNLEVGGSFTTSVKENAQGKRVRGNEGVLDLRLAPLPPMLNDFRDEGWQRTWRPFILDASVATGKIDKKTLARNTISMSSELEFWNGGTRERSNVYRIVTGVREASDRDFKKLEYTGNFRFVFHPGFLQRSRRGTRLLGHTFEFTPGAVEIGHADFRRRVPYIEVTDPFLRRFYFGGVARFLLSDTTVLSFEDFMYIRGETDVNRTKNYFKATLDSGLGLPTLVPGITQTIRLSFERGNRPPFASPDVNSFQVGLRFRWANWFN